MKIVAFEVSKNELEYFNNSNYDVKTYEECLSIENINLTKGYDAISVLGRSFVTKEMIDILVENNIKVLGTRTVGYDHIDIKYAKSKGIKVANSKYGPNGVADYTVMLILMCLRHYKQAMFRANVNDYSLKGLQGKEMHSLKVGIIGTGNIGGQVARNLSGFGCELIGYDMYQNESIKDILTYVSLEELYSQSDIITLHSPYLESTKYMINKDSIGKMKDGVIIINCARGELIKTDDLVEAVESGKIGALGLDVLENENGIYHQDLRSDIISNRNMAYLRQFPNVIMTQHMAFFTKEAVRSMVLNSLQGLDELSNKGESKFEL